MAYQVIARKWRPQTFSEVVGQQHVMRTLANSIRGNRVAHAYIFSGARGVGKTTTARILAKALNCVKGPTPEPCGECDACREIAAGTALDVLEIDAASNRGIDQVRELRDTVRYAPAGGRYKVVILDEAHMLTDEASNALLKTLEEPPERVVFVMATTEPEELAETIRSRSQHFHFRALAFGEIADALSNIAAKENLTVEPGALAVMARAADGSLRDALSLIEQARAYCGEAITEAQVRELLGLVSAEILDELTAAIEAQSAQRALGLVHRLLTEGQNLHQFCKEAIGHFRNLLVARVCGADSDLVAAPAEERPRLQRAAAAFSEEELTRFFQILLHIEDDLRRKPDPRLHLEMGLLRLVNAARLAPLEEVLAGLGGNTAPGAGSRPTAAPGNAASSGAEPSSPRTMAVGAPSSSTPTPASGAFAAPAAPAAPSGPAPAPAPSAPPYAKPAVREENAARTSSVSVANGSVSATAAATQTARTSSAETAAPATHSPAPAPQAAPSSGALDASRVEAIHAEITSQSQHFLATLVEPILRWELEGGELRLYFSTEDKNLADMLQSREQMEKLRTIAARALGQPVRVCVKLEVVPASSNSSKVRTGPSAHELRDRFEQDPIVRGLIERFGGRISDVKPPSEE